MDAKSNSMVTIIGGPTATTTPTPTPAPIPGFSGICVVVAIGIVAIILAIKRIK